MTLGRLIYTRGSSNDFARELLRKETAMAGRRRLIWPYALVVVGCIAGFTAHMSATPQNARQVDAKFFQDLRWRSIGPPRAGRVVAVAGVQREPETYYFGSVGVGVWK